MFYVTYDKSTGRVLTATRKPIFSTNEKYGVIETEKLPKGPLMGLWVSNGRLTRAGSQSVDAKARRRRSQEALDAKTSIVDRFWELHQYLKDEENTLAEAIELLGTAVFGPKK